MSDLPPGLVLGPAPQKQGSDLPPGLVSGPAPTKTPSVAERLWNTASGMVQAPTRFAQGLAEGVAGEGIPAGRASQFEGGAARFGGRAIGTGVSSVAERLWNDVVKAPGKMLYGETPLIGDPATGRLRSPEGEAAARSIAMGMAGQGGFAPGRALPGLAERPPRFNLGGQPPAAPAAVGGSMRMAPVQMPSVPPKLTQSPPLTPQQMPPTAAAPPPPRSAPLPKPPGNPQADAATVSMYRQAVLPSRGQRSRGSQMDAYNQSVTTGVDEIIGNQPNLVLTAPNGTPLPPGSTVPRNMKQFSEAIDQSEATLFEQWNPMTSRAGEKGLRIDLAPVAAELRSLAKKPEVVGVNPAAVSQMENFAGIYDNLGAVTPLEAQKIVTGINQRLSSFYAKGEAASGAPAEVLAPVARMLRKALDDGIEAAEGPGWQELRNRYGALRSIEKDVTRAAERLANKPSSFLGKAGNFLASREFAHALVTLNPAAMARAVGTKGAVELHKFYNDPNLMIERMFRQRMAPPSPPPSLAAPAFQAAQPAMGYRLAQPSGGFPQPKRDPDQPLRQPVF